MKVIKHLSIVFISFILCSAVYADQAQLITQKEANLAMQMLTSNKVNVIKKFCKPCGDLLPKNVVVEKVSIQDGHYKGLWELVVNGEAIDLAYYYLPINNRWKNFARAVDIYVDDMPKYLESINLDKVLAVHPGWYVEKQKKIDIIATKEVNYGALFAILGMGGFNKPTVLFQSNEPENCSDGLSTSPKTMPMYVNESLVRFSVICKEKVVAFYPETETGSDFVLEQFMDKPFVTLKPYSSEDDFVFSSKGFKKLHDKAMNKL